MTPPTPSPLALPTGYQVRLLIPGDEPAVASFLRAHADSSMFLLSNLAAAGLEPGPSLQHGTWAAAFGPGPEGAGAANAPVAAVAGLYGFGILTLQAPDPALLPDVVRVCAAGSTLDVRGVGGPWDQVLRARAALGRDGDETTLAEAESLFALDLQELKPPPALLANPVRCRRATPAEVDWLVPWRIAYCLETGLEQDRPGLPLRVRATLAGAHERGGLFVLEDQAKLVATTAFNAQISGAVQVGGVYTPPELRSRGYGRAVVAGSLALARADGARRAVLFTPPSNPAAQKAYRSLGFKEIGDYGLVLFRTPRQGI